MCLFLPLIVAGSLFLQSQAAKQLIGTGGTGYDITQIKFKMCLRVELSIKGGMFISFIVLSLVAFCDKITL